MTNITPFYRSAVHLKQLGEHDKYSTKRQENCLLTVNGKYAENFDYEEAIKELQQILSIKSAQVKLVASNGEEILIPESVYNLLGQVVRAMASGQAVSIVTHNRELTVHQAADLLNVSRSFLVKLLDEKAIPYIEIGSRRRILFQDLMTYQQQRKVQRRQFLSELTEMTEEAGLYED